MHKTMLILSSILSLFILSAMAGCDHDHYHLPVDQEAVTIKAIKIIIESTKTNKLDKSWASITPSSVEKIMFKGYPEWVVVFVNNKIADPSKRTLYVFLALDGEYVAANYTRE